MAFFHCLLSFAIYTYQLSNLTARFSYRLATASKLMDSYLMKIFFGMIGSGWMESSHHSSYHPNSAPSIPSFCPP